MFAGCWGRKDVEGQGKQGHAHVMLAQTDNPQLGQYCCTHDAVVGGTYHSGRVYLTMLWL